jgi:hypothetical protein
MFLSHNLASCKIGVNITQIWMEIKFAQQSSVQTLVSNFIKKFAKSFLIWYMRMDETHRHSMLSG